jgi:hypothetical protein
MTKTTELPNGFKSKSLALLGAVFLFATMSSAQSIHFNFIDGTNEAYNLEDLSKITFDADVMNLHMLDGSLYAWNVSTIGYYQYDESSINVQEWLNDANAWEVAVYPNPTSTTLNVRFNMPKEDEVSIGLYDMQGKQILLKALGNKSFGSHQEMLDLTDIPNGTYVCRISGKYNSITKQVIKQ